MIEYVTSNVLGSKLTLLVANLVGQQPFNGVLLVDVKGLGPPSAIVHAEGGPNIPGAKVSYTKVEKRNIVVTAVIQETIWGDTDHGRETLYNYFPVNKQITFGVKKSSREEELFIQGVVESCEVNLFSQNENMDITIVCPFPFFTRGLPLEQVISPSGPTMIAYNGDEDTGFVITILFTGVTGNIDIFKDAGLSHMGIDMNIVGTIVGVPSAAGHQLVIDTRTGSKSIKYTAGGTTYNVMSALVSGSNWLTLHKGFNQFNYTLGSGSGVDMTFSYPELIMGV